jgi:phosphodiesterase/alkaline phosphatase D-like protein
MPVDRNKIATWLILFFSSQSHATLGKPVASIEQDNKTLHGRTSVTFSGDYSIHEIQSAGVDVREYALPDGTIFGMTWKGRVEPDFSVLLGDYFMEYEIILATTPLPMGRKARVLKSKNVVVVKFGHMRDVRGVAYVPYLTPKGFLFEDAS